MTRTLIHLLVYAVFLILIFYALTACAPMMAPPEQVIVTKEVERIVQVRCEDKRPPALMLPDSDEAIAAVAMGDIFGLAQIYRAARELYRQRLREDDEQIKACTGG